MTHKDFLIQMQIAQTIIFDSCRMLFEQNNPTVENVAMMTQAHCAESLLLSLIALGEPESTTPLADN